MPPPEEGGGWIPERMREAEGTPLERLRAGWPELVERCRLVQPMLQHVLRDSWPMELTESELTIGFDPEFAGEIEQARMLERGPMRNLFQRVLGHSVRIEYRVLTEPVNWSHQLVRGEEGEEALGAEGEFDAESAGLNPRAWLGNETIRQVLETFHGDILEIQT